MRERAVGLSKFYHFAVSACRLVLAFKVVLARLQRVGLSVWLWLHQAEIACHLFAIPPASGIAEVCCTL